MPMVNKLLFLTVCVLAAILLGGCEDPSRQAPAASSEPKTSFGKAVRSAKDLQDESDERNSAAEKQAAEILDETISEEDEE